MYVIVNPVAGRGRSRRVWPTIEAELRLQGLSFETVFTERPGHAKELAQQAVKSGYQVVVAVGGDGTLTEVVNGLAGSGVLLGLVPVGSGNDFARSLHIPQDITEAVGILAGGARLTVDLGRVGENYFINVAGVGFDAQVALTMAEKARWLKGTAAYVYAVFRCLFSCKPFPLRLELDGQEQRVNALLIAVANGQYIGGGMHIAPEAQVDDGYFDVVVLENISPFAFVKSFPSVFRGTHLTHPKIKLYRARNVSVEPLTNGQQIPAQAEGNFIGCAPQVFGIIPAAQQVLVAKAVVQTNHNYGKGLQLAQVD